MSAMEINHCLKVYVQGVWWKKMRWWDFFSFFFLILFSNVLPTLIEAICTIRVRNKSVLFTPNWVNIICLAFFFSLYSFFSECMPKVLFLYFSILYVAWAYNVTVVVLLFHFLWSFTSTKQKSFIYFLRRNST